MEITLKQLRSLLKTLEEGSVTEFEYQDDKYRLRLNVGRPEPVAAGGAGTTPAVDSRVQPSMIPAAAPGAVREDPNLVFVTSPFVGTFYRSSNPESDPFVEVGSSVKKGATLCIVEAMKLMNEIEAELPCTIVEVLAENGTSVEFGQRLFKVRKD
jgi:acetyl-CoA carboxylase biotin carboxyl carrier protein